MSKHHKIHRVLKSAVGLYGHNIVFVGSQADVAPYLDEHTVVDENHGDLHNADVVVYVGDGDPKEAAGYASSAKIIVVDESYTHDNGISLTHGPKRQVHANLSSMNQFLLDRSVPPIVLYADGFVSNELLQYSDYKDEEYCEPFVRVGFHNTSPESTTNAPTNTIETISELGGSTPVDAGTTTTVEVGTTTTSTDGADTIPIDTTTTTGTVDDKGTADTGENIAPETESTSDQTTTVDVGTTTTTNAAGPDEPCPNPTTTTTTEIVNEGDTTNQEEVTGNTTTTSEEPVTTTEQTTSTDPVAVNDGRSNPSDNNEDGNTTTTVVVTDNTFDGSGTDQTTTTVDVTSTTIDGGNEVSPSVNNEHIVSTDTNTSDTSTFTNNVPVDGGTVTGETTTTTTLDETGNRVDVVVQVELKDDTGTSNTLPTELPVDEGTSNVGGEQVSTPTPNVSDPIVETTTTDGFVIKTTIPPEHVESQDQEIVQVDEPSSTDTTTTIAVTNDNTVGGTNDATTPTGETVNETTTTESTGSISEGPSVGPEPSSTDAVVVDIPITGTTTVDTPTNADTDTGGSSEGVVVGGETTTTVSLSRQRALDLYNNKPLGQMTEEEKQLLRTEWLM